MADYKILNNEPISIAEIAEIIEEKAKDNELTYREEKVKEYAKKILKNDFKVSKQLIQEIKKLEINRLEEKQIIKIIEIMPKNGTELRAIIGNSGIVLVDENVTKILDVLSKFK